MSGRRPAPTVAPVALRVQRPGEAPARVLVIGGGVAGLDALIALRRLAGERVSLELITPEAASASWSTAVSRAFGHRRPPRIDVAAVSRQTGARLVNDSLASVDTSSRRVTLRSGEVRGYDRLLITVGALAEESIAGAVTFGVPGGAARVRRVLQHAQTGELRDVLFAVPALVGLPLGLYELALLAAQRLRGASTAPHLTVVTPERAPLIDFGAETSATALEELETHGIHVITGLMPEEIIWGELRTRPGKVRINADVVITLPRMRGPALPGLPCDDAGFIVVDDHGRVDGAPDVYAAGDATTFFPIKDAGLAADQAFAAAESIAAAVGVPLAPRPFRPIRAGILAGHDTAESVQSGAVGMPVRARW
jgi:sulfide:quinone oxidoreductase